MVLPRPDPAQLQLLRSYFDLSARREPDLVLLLDATADVDAVALRMGSEEYCLPFIDLTGHHLGADAQFSVADPLSWASVAACVGRFAERRRQLAPSIRQSIEPEARLLAYIFLSGRPLRPTIDASSRDCVTYPGFFSPAEVRRHAEHLAERGWLDRSFFDRFHLCASCSSSRLNVREECPVCHSAQLQEVSLIHHFRCAHQAPERDFTRGANLVCPKCRQHLRHYGSDYDRSGTAMSCGACGAISPEPLVGFTCLDCGARTSGQAAQSRDVFAYRLTDNGLDVVRRGLPRWIANAADRPDPALQQFERAGPGAALFELTYRGHAAVAASRGEEAFQSMRRTFLANLASALDGDAIVVPGSDRDHVILPAPTTDLLAKLASPLLHACQRDFAADLQPEVTLRRGQPDQRS